MIFSNQASRPMEECARARWATRRAGSSSTGAPPTSSSRASCRAPKRAGAARSCSPSTRRCSAGASATSTSRTCRSCAGRGSRSTRATRSSSRRSRRRCARRRRRRARIALAAHRDALGAGRVRSRGRDAREPPLRPRARRRPALRRDVLAAVALLGGPCVPARADATADPAQGHPPSGRRRGRDRARDGRDRRLQPRRPPGRRRGRDDGRAARRSSRPCAAASRCCSTAECAPARTSSARSRSARRAVGLGRPYVWGLAGGRRGRRARGDPQPPGGLRPHAGPRRLCVARGDHARRRAARLAWRARARGRSSDATRPGSASSRSTRPARSSG